MNSHESDLPRTYLPIHSLVLQEELENEHPVYWRHQESA